MYSMHSIDGRGDTQLDFKRFETLQKKIFEMYNSKYFTVCRKQW